VKSGMAYVGYDFGQQLTAEEKGRLDIAVRSGLKFKTGPGSIAGGVSCSYGSRGYRKPRSKPGWPSKSEAVTSGNLAGAASFSMTSKSPSQGGRLSSDRMSDEQCRGAYRYSAPSSSGPDRAAPPWQTSRDRLLWDGLHGVCSGYV